MRILRQLSSLRAALATTLTVAALLILPANAASAQLASPAPLKYVPGQTLRTMAGVHSSQTPQAVLDGTAVPVGHYEPTNMLRLAIVLLPPHPVEEGQFLRDLQDKTSPSFHQYLTPEDWTARFGPSAEDEQAVADWAQSQGLTITYRSKHRMVVDVEATAGTIEKALGVTINKYQVLNADGTPGETRYSADRDPVLPSRIASVVSWVGGLNSFERVQPASGPEPNVIQPDYVPGPASATQWTSHADAKPASTGAKAETSDLTPSVSAPPAGYYAPSDIWSYDGYDYLALMNQGHCCNPLGNSGHSPVQTSIAIAGYDPLSLSDVANFQSYFSYLAYEIQTIGVDGGLTCDPSAGTCGGEASLDNEWAISTSNSRGAASNTAKVYYYNAPNGDATDVWTHIMDDGNARVMSQSWGAAEPNSTNSSLQAQDSILATMAGEGWTLLFSSGDQGSTGACNDALKVIYPASDPNVIGVGGTTLQINYRTEVGWTGGTNPGNPNTNPPTPDSCSSNGGGSTGGFSDVWPTPGFQSGMGFSSRAVPDMALNANVGQYVYVNDGWAHLGGTSIATPMLAGFMAQENAYLLSLGDVCGSGKQACGTLGDVNYAIYDEALNHDAAHIPFYDITSGCSSNDITQKYNLTPWCATTGFDEVTGWGSANMLQLAWAINWQDTAAYGEPYVSWSGPATNTWYNSNQNVSWTIEDYTGSSSDNGVGIAGFNQGWDSIPPDSTTQPANFSAPAATDTFFDGPQYPNATTGCLALASGQGCSGGVSQGCHTAHVRGFNNQGETTGDATYGPVCYDTVAPTITLTSYPDVFSGFWDAVGSTITLATADPGGSAASGIATTYYGVDSPYCSTTLTLFCNTYTSPFAVNTQGAHTITYFTEDNAGNFSSVGTFDLWIDLTPPVTTIGLSGNLVTNYWDTAVTVTLSATDTGGSGVKNTFYSIDGGLYNAYISPFKVSTPGVHTIKYSSNDKAGNEEATNTTTFTIESPVSTSLAVNPTTSSAGSSVTLTATLTPTLSGGTPTGTVTFYNSNGNTKLGTANLSGLTATLSTTALPVGANTLYAVYNGATYYLQSTSNTVPETTTTTTTTVLTSSQNNVSYGTYISLNGAVSAPSGPAPTGTVSFYDGSTLLGTEPLAMDGDAVITNVLLSAGSHALKAIYNPSAAFDLTSTSSTLSETITTTSTTTAVTSTLNPATYGEAVTFNATVTPSVFVLVSGTMTFKDGTAVIGSVPMNGSNAVSLTTASLKGGAHSITAVYSGSSNETGSTSPALSETVNASATTTTVTAPVTASTFGESVTFTANVTPTTGTVPTGTVTFYDGTTGLSVVNLDPNGSATYTTSNLKVGTHPITAAYKATANDAASTSTAFTETVTASATTTTLTSSLNPSGVGAPVTFTATVGAVTGPTPTGTVTFKTGSTILGTEALTAGVATFTTSSLPLGTSSITGIFNPDVDDATSTSAVLSQVVTVNTTTTTVTAPSTTATFGQLVTFTATVSAGAGAVPKGTVTFYDGTTGLSVVSLSSTGTATYSTSTLKLGAHSITAAYKATTNDSASTSPVFTETVAASPTTTTLTSSLNPSTVGAAVKFTATVAATSGPTPTGSVTFKAGTTNLGSVALSSGTASLAISTLPLGASSITAVYNGYADATTSTSAVLTQTVTAVPTTTTLTSSLNPAGYGASVTFTATVAAASGSTPTGSVTFKNGTTNLGTVTLSSGSATFTTSTLGVGAFSITAVYNGTTTDATSTSTVLSQSITAASTTTTVTAPVSTATSGTSITFTATVTAASGGTPKGSVTFYDGTAGLSVVNLTSTGTATYTSSTLKVGTHSITAVYKATTDDATSTSTVFTETITAAP